MLKAQAKLVLWILVFTLATSSPAAIKLSPRFTVKTCMALVALSSLGSLAYRQWYLTPVPPDKCPQCEALWYEDREGRSDFNDPQELHHQAVKIAHATDHLSVMGGGRQWATQNWEIIYFHRNLPDVDYLLRYYRVSPTPAAILKHLSSNGVSLAAEAVPAIIENEARHGRVASKKARILWNILQYDTDVRTACYEAPKVWDRSVASFNPIQDNDAEAVTTAVLWVYQNRRDGLVALEKTIRNLALTHAIADPMYREFEDRVLFAPGSLEPALRYPPTANKFVDIPNVEARRLITRYRLWEYILAEEKMNPGLTIGQAVKKLFGVTVEDVIGVQEAPPK